MKKKLGGKQRTIKQLHNKALALWKAIAFARDGHECQVKKFLNNGLIHSEILQVDHCFTRMNKKLFYSPHNSTVVCASCNFRKKHRLNSVDRIVDEIVKQREGIEKFNEMYECDKSEHCNPDYKNILWLEDTVRNLESTLEQINKSKVESNKISIEYDFSVKE